MSRIYLGGPMTGVPDLNRPLFNATAAELRAQGHDVVNPAELNQEHPEWTWEQFMRADLALMLDCDRVALLPRWQESRGASFEKMIADTLGMPIDYL